MTEFLTTNIYLQILLAFGLGILASCINQLCFKPGKSLLLSSLLLPPVVCVALLAVNGSIGTSIAVLGVFGLVRFRSLPGKSSDMVCILFAMVMGLLAASGSIWTTVLVALMLSALIVLGTFILNRRPEEMEIHIVVPEDDPAENEYRKLLARYGKNVRLDKMKTAGMGTLYELTYRFVPHTVNDNSQMLEEIRSRNGNLSVTLFRASSAESF